MTTREPIRFECPYCAQIVGDYVTGTAHDKLVGELQARIATLEAVITDSALDCNECGGNGLYKSRVDGLDNECDACASLRGALRQVLGEK